MSETVNSKFDGIQNKSMALSIVVLPLMPSSWENAVVPKNWNAASVRSLSSVEDAVVSLMNVVNEQKMLTDIS